MLVFRGGCLATWQFSKAAAYTGCLAVGQTGDGRSLCRSGETTTARFLYRGFHVELVRTDNCNLPNDKTTRPAAVRHFLTSKFRTSPTSAAPGLGRQLSASRPQALRRLSTGVALVVKFISTSGIM